MADLINGALGAISQAVDSLVGDDATTSAAAPATSTAVATTTSSKRTPTPTTTSQQSTSTPSSTSSIATSTATSSSLSSTLSTSISSSSHTITSHTASTTTSTPSATPSSAPDSSNTGAIAAGVIACLAAVGLAIALGIWWYKRKQKSKRMSFREAKEFHRMEERSLPAVDDTPFSPDSYTRPEKLELKPQPPPKVGRKPVPVVCEMEDTSRPAEMDGGQMYHAYKPGR